MSAATYTRRSLVAFSALLGFSAMADARPHAVHPLRELSHDYHQASPRYVYGVSPYRVYGSVGQSGRPFNRQSSRARWDVRHGIGLYDSNAYGYFGVSQYGLYDRGRGSRAHVPMDLHHR